MSSPDTANRERGAKGRRVVKVIAAVVAVLVLAVMALYAAAPSSGDYSASRLLIAVDEGRVKHAKIYPRDDRVEITTHDGTTDRAAYPGTDAGTLIDRLDASGAEIEVASYNAGASWLFYLLPIALFVSFWAWLARRLRRADRAD